MAIFFDAPVPPVALTTYLRTIPTPSRFALTALFPTRNLTTNTVDFAEIVRTNRTARFRSFDGRIHVSERDTGGIKAVNLLPLSSSLSMGEFERLQLEFARTGGTFQSALATAIYNDGDILIGEVQARIEQAWGDVLSDGKLTINENGYQGEADFGVPSNQIVAPATLWSTTASATALDDLVSWNDAYIAANGFGAGTVLTSNRVQRYLQRNIQLINAIRGAQTGVTRVTMVEINDLLSSEGLPTIGTPYDTQVDVDGTSTRVIADDKLIFLPPNIEDLGYTAFGVSATGLELVNSNVSDFTFGDASGIVGVVEKVGPPYRQFTYVDAVAMPILQQGRLLLIADVA